MQRETPTPTTPFFLALTRAHAQLEDTLQALELAAEGLTDPQRAPLATQAVLAALTTFTAVSRLHNDDEEKTLFPRLAGRPELAQMLSAFDFQHRMNETEEAALEAGLRQGTAHGPALRKQVLRFTEMGRAHMLAEERALFPMAEQSLSRDVLTQLVDELRVSNA
jgi:hemerythrin-like domain-containing protein